MPLAWINEKYLINSLSQTPPTLFLIPLNSYLTYLTGIFDWVISISNENVFDVMPSLTVNDTVFVPVVS